MVNYELINFKNNKIFKVKLDEMDNNLLIQESEFLKNFFSKHHIEKSGPGIQINLIMCSDDKFPEITKFRSESYNVVKNLHNELFPHKVNFGFNHSWVFISEPSNTKSNYHEHNMFEPRWFPNIQTTYTCTYYPQIPNNLKDKEGYLFFKNNLDDDEETNSFSFLPEVGYLYVFPANLQHRPELSPNSTNDRICFATNIVFEFEKIKKML